MPDWKQFRIIIGFVILAWLVCLLVAIFGPEDISKRGQFGDVFGSVNALFSGLAFTGLIYTVMLQRNELLLQREELKLQREEMTKSREALTEQAEIQARQFKAAIIGIKVSAKEAQLQALRMRFEINSDTHKIPVIDSVDFVANQILEFANELERSQG